jgi:hypothetical protein
MQKSSNGCRTHGLDVHTGQKMDTNQSKNILELSAACCCMPLLFVLTEQKAKSGENDASIFYFVILGARFNDTQRHNDTQQQQICLALN